MKHRLFKLVVFLLLGAVTTVGVSWFCVLRTTWGRWEDLFTVEVGSWPLTSPRWEVAGEMTFGATVITSSLECDWKPFSNEFHIGSGYDPIETWLPRWAFPRAARPDDLHPTCDWHLAETASGWPFLAAYSSMLWKLLGPGGEGSGAEIDAKIYGGITGPWLQPPETEWWQFALPLKPLWLGFALDTLVYGALWGGLLLVPRLGRRFVRFSRGCCGSCGYDLRGEFSSGCPECGWRREAEA